MSRALAHAANWFGLVSIAGAIVTASSLALHGGNSAYWLTATALVPMGVLLAVLSVKRSVALSVSYLVVGGLCTFIYAWSLLSDNATFPFSNLFIIALPKMALVMVGGAGSGALLGVIWTTAGLVTAELASASAALVAGSEIRPDSTTLLTYLLLVALLLFDGLTRRTARVAQAVIHRAAREDRALELRRELELRAAAHLHDTALSQLILIAESPAGPVDPRLGAQITRDLSTLVDDDWLLAATRAAAHRDRFAPHSAQPQELARTGGSEITTAIEDATARGLTVQLSGDPAALALLDPHLDLALGQALRQCLYNVLRHAAVTEADVSIVAMPGEFTVIVVDDGVGFDSAALAAAQAGTHSGSTPLQPTGADSTTRQALGLRNSVQHRIESVGGTVEIWSRADVGTSVMMSVPLRSARSESEEGTHR